MNMRHMRRLHPSMTRTTRKVDIMGCEKEKMGESISFESFESEKCEHISVPEAEAQQAKAEEIRAGEGA